ncbi:MFS transporter [Alkalihalobacillus trypoxylicola]|uniref:Major facilitator superfamily (MFS) profile domain-containing protein n=1 Tax=Alkalihalobacillus trypoxylicola TaxID=519424 RepID=A0A162D694_9BACI|nr:MFS transporter [Alkalihalobacillus trypoxylicola]KYG28269.1 hypothetical protein AZF04_10245 [Alkalihalobacillus trypoxylicola]
MFSILRNTSFRMAWLSYTTSSAATSITPIILTLFLLDSYGGIGALGLVLGTRTLGFVGGAILGFGMIDDLPRRRTMIIASLVRGIAIITAIIIFDHSILAICITVFFAGMGEGIFRGAYQSLIAEVIEESQLQQANALSTFSNRFLLVVSPAMATIVYAWIGGSLSLLVIGLLWLFSMVLANTLPKREAKVSIKSKTRVPFKSFGEVFVEVSRHRWFIGGLTGLVVWLTLGYAIQQLTLPVITRDVFGNDTFIGFALGSYSLGALIAALWLAKSKPRLPGLIAFIGLSMYGLVPLALVVLDVSHHLGALFVLLAFFLGGLGIEAFNIPWFSAIQREMPQDKMGRIFSLDFTISYGIAPLGLVFLPYFITTFGQNNVLLICGLLTIASALIILLVPGALRLSDPRYQKGDKRLNNIER